MPKIETVKKTVKVEEKVITLTERELGDILSNALDIVLKEIIKAGSNACKNVLTATLVTTFHQEEFNAEMEKRKKLEEEAKKEPVNTPAPVKEILKKNKGAKK